MTEHSKVKRGVGFLVAMVVSVLIGGGCFQPIDVGSDLQEIAHVDELDGGFGRGPDGGVACGPECDPEDGGSPLCAGDLLINSAQAWENFNRLGCLRFSGSLTIRPEIPIADLSNGVLQTVSGNLRVIANPTSVSFPALTTVGGTLDIALSNALTSVNLRKLEHAGGLAVIGNPALTALELPALATVRGSLSIQMSALTSLSLPALQTIRGTGVGIVNNPSLAAISLPALHAPGLVFAVNDNPALTSLVLPVLTVAESIGVARNEALLMVEAPLLANVIGSLTIIENATLSTLFLPSLATVRHNFFVYSNPRLPQCSVDSLEAQLTAAPAIFTAANNAGTCP